MELQKAAEYSHNIENIISYHVFSTPTVGFLSNSQNKQVILEVYLLCSKSRTDQACSVKMAGYSFL